MGAAAGTGSAPSPPPEETSRETDPPFAAGASVLRQHRGHAIARPSAQAGGAPTLSAAPPNSARPLTDPQTERAARTLADAGIHNE